MKSENTYEVIKSIQGFDNYRFNGTITEELKKYLRDNGYVWSHSNRCYYPASRSAKENNSNFTLELESFVNNPEGRQEKNPMTAQLEDLFKELQEQVRIQAEKISQLEMQLKEQNKNREVDNNGEEKSENAANEIGNENFLDSEQADKIDNEVFQTEFKKSKITSFKPELDLNVFNNAEKLLPDNYAEKGMSVPELKTYHTLKKEDVENLQIISDEEFSDVVDSIILNDYKNIPNVIRLPNIKGELAEKLGLEKDSAFVLKKEATHIRPDRKGNYNQALDTEEYREIPKVIRDADFAIVDKRTKNFQLLFDDKNEISKINKIVFNKDELGNYLVTIGKVDRRDGLSEKEQIVVGVGVAPTISALRFPEELPATRLRPSSTTIDSNISHSEEMSMEYPESLSRKLSSRNTIWFKNEDKTVKDMVDYLAEINMADFSLEKKDDNSLYIQGYDNGMKPRGRMKIDIAELQYLYNKMNNDNAKEKLHQKFTNLTGKVLFENSVSKETKTLELTPEDIELCKKVIPPSQFRFTMELTEGEEGEFFRNKMKEIADTYRRINTNSELTNEDGTHNVGFRYFLGDKEIFLSEIDSDGIGFGYNILNGDLQMSEWGSTSLEEIMKIPYIEMDYHVPEGITIERMLYQEHPEYFSEYAPKEDLLNVINFSNWTYFNSEKISTKVYDVEISASLYEQLLPSEYKERSIKEDEVVCIQYRKSVVSEEQDQFLISKFNKNNFMLLQQKEIQIDVELKNKIKSICNSYIEPQNNNSYTNEILNKIRAAGINVEISAERIQEILTLGKTISKMTMDIQEFEEKRKEIENIRNYIPIISDENKSLVREQEFIDFQTSLVACKKFIDDLPGKKLPEIKFTAQNNRGEDVKIDLMVQNKDGHLVLTTPSNTLIYDFETKVVENNFIFEAFKDYNATNNCSDILVKTINDNLGKQLGEQRRKLKKLMQENAVLSGKALNELSEEETKELKEKLKDLDYEQVEGILVHKDKKIALTPEDYIKEVKNAKLLVDHNHTVYLLPENFAFRRINEKGKLESNSTPDTLTDNEFLELKTTDKKLGKRFGEAVEQANSVLIRIQDNISVYNARKRLQTKINKLQEENRKEIKDGKLFLYFEKKGEYVEAEIKRGKINILPAMPSLADLTETRPTSDILSQAEELSSSIPKVNKMMARSGLYWNGKPYEYTMAQYALNSNLDMKWLNHFFGTTSSDIHQFNQILQPQVAQEKLKELLKTAESMDYTGDAVSHKSKIGKERLRTFEMFAEQIRNGNIGYYDTGAALSTGTTNWTTVNGSEVINEPEYMFKNGFVAGLAYDNNIILHPDYLSSNAAVHEYTHLWDAYTQKTNPELWNKGLELFKDTKYWNEVISDPNYQDIKNDENLVLSEIHSRICGNIAEKVLERIAELDGEQVKLDAIDWDKKTWEYIAFELDMHVGTDIAKDVHEFLSTPMKDLIASKNINVSKELSWEELASLFQEHDSSTLGDFKTTKETVQKEETFETQKEYKDEVVLRRLDDILDFHAYANDGTDITDDNGNPYSDKVLEEKYLILEQISAGIVDGNITSLDNAQIMLNDKLLNSELYKEISQKLNQKLPVIEANGIGAGIEAVTGLSAEQNNTLTDELGMSVSLPSNTVDLTDLFDNKLKNQSEIVKYLKSLADEVFITYDNYKIGITPKDSKHIVYTNGSPYRSQKVRINNYLMNLEKVLKNAEFKGESPAQGKENVESFYYFTVPVKVGNGLYTVKFDCKKNSDVVIAKEQSSNKLTDNNITVIDNNRVLEISQVDCYLYNVKERVITRNLEKSEITKTITPPSPTQEEIELPWDENVSPEMESKIDSGEIFGTNTSDINIFKELVQKEESSPKTKGDIRKIRAQCKSILEKNDYEITEKEKRILAQYEGGGGINEKNRTDNEILNAFYTPRNIVKAAWKLADYYCPSGKTVLEPTAGVGRFAEGREDKKFTLREIDPTSARIARILHPNAEVINEAFEEQFFEEDGLVHNPNFQLPKFDIVIGNPPYGSNKGEYKGKGEGKNHDRYEEYFIEKGLDSLNGMDSVLIYVVPSGFLRSKPDNPKKLIAEKGTLIDAWRLPNKSFDSTDVGTDIIVMKKKDPSVSNDKNLELICNDNFIKSHPDRILGVEGTRIGRFGEEYCVTLPKGRSLDDLIIEKFSFMKSTRNEIRDNEITDTKAVEKSRKTLIHAAEKSIGDVLSTEEFNLMYGTNYTQDEINIWRKTDWEGNINVKDLFENEVLALSNSDKFIQVLPGVYQPILIFESGDINLKIEKYKELLESEKNENIKKLYENNISLLEESLPHQMTLDQIHIAVNSAMAEQMTVELTGSEGYKHKVNLQEAFIIWAKGDDPDWLSDRSFIEYSVANINQEDLPTNITWEDIVEYIDKKIVKAQKTQNYRWRSEEETQQLKNERHKEAQEKKSARQETANMLFDRFIHEGLDSKSQALLVSEYTKRFNNYVPTRWEKMPMFVEGMSAYKGENKFRLYDQQIKGVSFLSNKGNGCLAYDVGVGKTATGIVAVVNQLQSGRCKRPLIIVPNPVYEKWITDIQQLFPNIKVNGIFNLSKDYGDQYRNSEDLHMLVPGDFDHSVTGEKSQKVTRENDQKSHLTPLIIQFPEDCQKQFLPFL